MPTRSEIGASLNLSESLIPTTMRNRPGAPMRPTSLTIHNTDNPDPGANAAAHANFVTKKGYYTRNGKKYWVSWHYSVDDGQAIKHLPIHEVSYHAGTAANESSISIEICMNSDIDQQAADDRATRLVAVLLYDLGFNRNNVRTHQSWTTKNCPSKLLGSSSGMDWNTFIDAVEQYRSSITPDAAFAPSSDLIASDVRELPSEEVIAKRTFKGDVLADLDTEIDHEAVRKSMQEIE